MNQGGHIFESLESLAQGIKQIILVQSLALGSLYFTLLDFTLLDFTLLDWGEISCFIRCFTRSINH